MIACIEKLDNIMTAQTISEFGIWLKEKREAAHLSVRELSRLTQNICSPSYISLLENNDTLGKKGKPIKPDVAIVDALAMAMNVPVNEAREKAGHPRTEDEWSPEKVYEEFTYAVTKSRLLSERSRSFLNKHISATVDFLIESEKEFGRGEFEPPNEIIEPVESEMKLDLPELLSDEEMIRRGFKKAKIKKKENPPES